MGEIKLTTIDACVRCEVEPPELGRALCKTCIAALEKPEPSRPENGKPAGARRPSKPPTPFRGSYKNGGGL
jgi:hypothetical protein